MVRKEHGALSLCRSVCVFMYACAFVGRKRRPVNKEERIAAYWLNERLLVPTVLYTWTEATLLTAALQVHPCLRFVDQLEEGTTGKRFRKRWRSRIAILPLTVF